MDREVHFSPRSYLLPLFLKRRARKIFLVPPPFPPKLFSPLPPPCPSSPHSAPHLPLPSYPARPPPLIFTSLPSENSHAIRICRTSITAFSLSHNPPLQNRGGHARQRGSFSNFRKSTSRVTKFTLSLYQVKSNSVQRLQTKSKKYLSKLEAMAVIFVFRSARKKKHEVSRGLSVFASCHASSNSIQRLLRNNRTWLSQSEARATVFIFRSATKHDLVIGHWVLASWKVWSTLIELENSPIELESSLN